MKPQSFSLEWGGRELVIETGKLAQQANGSCTVRYGDTVVLGTAVMSDTVREGMTFFPLMVEYEEKLYAAGKIKGSRFIKRETRPSDDAVVTARLIDRAIRPLFDQKARNDIQVILTALSFDGENDTDIVGFIAAAASLAISDIPFNGQLAAVRVGQIASEDGTKKEWVLNPTYEARAKSAMDMIIAGDGERVIMIEAEGKEFPEADAIEAIAFAQKHIRKVVDLIGKVRAAVGEPKRVMDVPQDDEAAAAEREMKTKVEAFIRARAPEELFGEPKATKAERKAAVGTLSAMFDATLQEEQVGKEKRKVALDMLHDAVEGEITRAILERDQRADGRALTEIRTLTAEVGLLPRTHGSALFSRGETQVLSVVTLGAPSDQQIVEGLEPEEKKHYMHHYNFPPFSVGEVKPLRGASRRDIGHGTLAEKALVPVLPDKEKFPYTIRVVSEVLSSNGSSSMASVCGSTLALMDAGVPIRKPVAGIAMGLASDAAGRAKVLTDLQDLEDGTGGMDFKVAGTDTGITAVQLDTKTLGLSMDIVRETFRRAYDARMEILGVMAKALPAPRADLSKYAPRITALQINPELIRIVIGPGGKMINEIISKTGVDIDIEDSGLVMITAVDPVGAEKAIAWIKQLTREVKAGDVFEGKVTRIMDFGAFVEVTPNKDGLVHISELAPYHVNQVTDIVQLGQVIPVKVIEIDELGRINLSLKQTDYKDYPPAPEGPRSSFGGRPMQTGSRRGPPHRSRS